MCLKKYDLDKMSEKNYLISKLTKLWENIFQISTFVYYIM